MGALIIFGLIGILGMICFFAFAPKFLGAMSKKMIDVEKDVITDKEDELKYIADKKADISKDAITKTTRAIKSGFVDEVMYCKHCGAEIDADSSFCKKCGKPQ